MNIPLNLPPAPRYYVGYSGGRDSHVLLDSLCRLRDAGELHGALSAIHVNHNLNPSALAWVQHCQDICAGYDVPLIVETLTESPKAGDSLEAFARTARYRCIERYIRAGEVFLSAHHQRDQAETFLLQLMRGAGLEGLRAMPVERALGAGRYVRPLLAVSYAEIVAYAQAHQLDFIVDDSNDDQRFDRNFLRHSVLPVLEQRFPKACAQIAQSAQWLAEVPMPAVPAHLRLDEVRSLAPAVQKQQLRAFVKSKTGQALSQAQTQYLLKHHLHARADKHPTLTVGDFVVRRHAGTLCVTKPLSEQVTESLRAALFPEGRTRALTLGECVKTPPLGELTWTVGEGFSLREGLTLCPLRGAERFHPHTRSRATTVKKCLNEAKIPAWLRPYYFGIYWHDMLIAIPNVGVSRPHYQVGEHARLPRWQITADWIGI